MSSSPTPAHLLCSEALQNKFCWVAEHIAGNRRRAGHAGQDVGFEVSLKHLEIFQNKKPEFRVDIFNGAKMTQARDINTH